MRNFDWHVHLYGCFSANELWSLAQGRTPNEERLSWFAGEYQSAFGRLPDTKSYFTHGEGKEAFNQDYHPDNLNSFARFQAVINLPIALFPLSPSNPGLLPHALEKFSHGVELRCFVPPYFDEGQWDEYLQTLTNTFESYPKSSLALSIPRSDSNGQFPITDFILRWLERNPIPAKQVSGFDFCGSEQGFSPTKMQALCRHIQSKSSLPILYHVGEDWGHLTPDSAIRWVFEAAQLGAKRLGHCLALGIHPQNWIGKTFVEDPEEALAHRHWLNLHGLQEYAPPKAPYTMQASDVERLYALQDWVIESLVERDTIIECCPSSNIAISGITSAKEHPYHRFKKSGVKLVIGTDDPGIFQTNLTKEWELLGE